jgi:hypothetical protein
MSVLLTYSGGANKLTASPGSPPASDPHTIAGWCFPTSATNFNEQVEINLSGGGISVLAGGASGTNICWRMSDATFAAFTDLTAVVSLSTWHHVCGTYDGTTMRLYVDGLQVSTATPGYGSRAGTWGVCAVGPTDGTVSDAVFYSAALSAADVFELFARRQPERRTNLEMSYPLFTGSAARLIDYSGKARSLALTGSAADGTVNPPASWGTTHPMLIQSGAVAITATGGVQVSGAAAMTAAAALNASGGVLVSGSAAMTMLAQLQASGGVLVNGLAVMTSNAPSAPADPVGVYDPRHIVKKPWGPMRAP